MEPISYEIIAGIMISCFAFIIIFKVSATRFFILSFPLLFLIYFHFFIVFGSFILFFETGNSIAYYAIIFSVFSFAIGSYLMKVITGFSPSQELKYFSNLPPVAPEESSRGPYMIFFGFLLASFFLVLYFKFSGVVPIYNMSERLMTEGMDQAIEDVKIDRLKATYFQLSEGEYVGQGYINQFRIVIIPMIFYYCLAAWLINRRLNWKILTILTLIVSVFGLYATGERGRIGIFILNLMLLFLYFRSKSINYRFFAKMFLLIVSVFFVTTFFLGRFTYEDNLSANVSVVFDSMVERLFFGNTINTYLIIDTFEESQSFKVGEVNFGDLLGFLPGTQRSFSNLMMEDLYGRDVGTASSSFTAQGYADYGMTGCILCGLFLGMLTQFIFVTFIRKTNRAGRKTPNMGAFFAVTAGSLTVLSLGSVFSFLEQGFLSGFLLYLLINWGLKFTRRPAPKMVFPHPVRINNASSLPARD